MKLEMGQLLGLGTDQKSALNGQVNEEGDREMQTFIYRFSVNIL